MVHEYSELVPNQCIVSKATSGFVLTFTLAGEDDGTRLTLDGEWAVHVPLVDAPLEDVLAHLKDPAQSWGDMATKVHNVKLTPEGVDTTFEWESKMFGFHVTGINEFTEFVPNQRLVVTASKGFVFSFTLEPAGTP